MHSSRFLAPSFRPKVKMSISLLSAALFFFTALAAHTQAYTSIVVFGDSLSDTGNFARLSQAKYLERVPGPLVDYTDGRFTDGTDTVPAAHNYNGVWIEQLAAMLPAKPPIKNSLDGGTDYAYGDATTANGTSVSSFGPGNAFSVSVNNIGQQISDYLATSPKITKKTLFVVWGGANDVLEATSLESVVLAAVQESANLQRLIDAGATQFLIPNLPPLGLIPRLNGSPLTSVPATAASALYNERLALGVVLLRYLNPKKTLALAELDVYGLFKNVAAKPAKYALANVKSSSQGNYTVNPDTYLFWDDLHPTTRGHNLLAETAAKLLGVGESSTVAGMEEAAPAVTLNAVSSGLRD